MANIVSFLDPHEVLNPAQKEAVLTTDGPVLIIAGAGSGKTKTLVHRVARLVEAGTPAHRILLLTFTRKSAQEMLRRATQILDQRCQQVSGGTFHAFSTAVLRKHAAEIGFTDQFTILDRGDAEDTVQLVRQDPKYLGFGKRFPKKNTLADIFSKVRNTQKTVSEVIQRSYPQFFEFSEDIEKIFYAYQELKKQMQSMDYDDLLLELANMLKTVPHVRRQLQNAFDYIMVDEYQDTNTIQADIIKAIANEKNNVCVVGDDAQSIYSFRGANFKNIMAFPDLFPGAKIITLEENYRSTQPILDLTNAIIEQARERYAKTLFTQKEGGKKPIYVDLDTEATQSKFVAQQVLKLREEGIALNQMAVLMRSGWHSNDLEIVLQTHGIPFVKVGGFKFIELAHVKDILAFLRVKQNPLDRISWQRLLLLFEGVGPKAAEMIWVYIQECLRQAIIPDSQPFRNKSFGKNLSEIFDIVFSDTTLPLDLQLQAIISQYAPIFKRKYDDFHKRQADLNSILTISERYHSLEAFLTDMSLEPPDGSQVDAQATLEDEKPMTLSTIHSSKGLEWRVVFVLSAIDGYLPSMQSLDDMGQLEEERRLLYVALTRAKEHLFVLKPHLDGQSSYQRRGMTFSKVSRFLKDANILKRFMEKWIIAEKRKQVSYEDSDFDDRPYVF